MPPHPKKLKRNGPSANADDEAAAEKADHIAAPETSNTNADNNIIDDILDDIEHNPTIHGMSNKLTSRILGFLGYKDIMRSRICCKKFRDSARTTMVPWTDYRGGDAFSYYSRALESQFRVDGKRKYKAMVAMTTALPYLQQLEIGSIKTRHKYCDGEDPDEERAAETAGWTTHDIQMISKFTQLRHLKIYDATMIGRYPVLFNFPLLQLLQISYCSDLKCDLDMLTGLPSLRELYISTNGYDKHLTGDIRSLRKLKNTLEKVRLTNSYIEGDFMDLADFPNLKSLTLQGCSLVTGDMREIGENDFALLEAEALNLGKPVIGSRSHEFQRILDVPSVAEAIYRLTQRDPPLIEDLYNIYWSLSRDSPEWYDSNSESGHPPPPFFIGFVQAGPRVGWRWELSPDNRCTNSCEINWLDPEPDRESSDYEVYNRELQSIQEEIFCFEGYYQPPSQDDYKRLCEEYYGI